MFFPKKWSIVPKIILCLKLLSFSPNSNLYKSISPQLFHLVFFPKMGHSKKIVLFLKPDPFLQKIFRMQPTTWYNWFFNPKTVLFLQNLIHWLTSIDQILTTQSYNSLPSLLLCLANVRFIKTGTKSSSLLLLCFVPVFLKQTLELHN